MTDAFTDMDVDDMATDLGMTPHEVRKALREAVAAGFLVVESIHPNVVILRGVIPAELAERSTP